MGLKLPLTAQNISIVKSYLKYICRTFQTLEIPYGSSGLAHAILSKGGTDRTLIAHMSLPVEDILKLLQDQGIVMIEPTIIRVVRPEELDIPAFQTSIIQSFSPNKKNS